MDSIKNINTKTKMDSMMNIDTETKEVCTLEIDPDKLFDDTNSEILFSAENDSPWIMKIAHGGKVSFNTEDYPDMKADDFASAVMDILAELPGLERSLE